MINNSKRTCFKIDKNKLIMSKLRSKNKIAKHRIEVLEKRVQDLVGMNDELEIMI